MYKINILFLHHDLYIECTYGMKILHLYVCVSLSMVPWSAFHGACFSDLSNVLKWSSNSSGVNRQAPTWLEIATQLAGELGHQIGYDL